MDQQYREILVTKLRERYKHTSETQAYIAQKIKVSQGRVSQWLSGKSLPNNPAILENLIIFLGEDPRDYV